MRIDKFIGWGLLIVMACSSDEQVSKNAWKKNAGNPVLQRGEPFNYDFYAISDCWVMFHEGIYKLWYTSGGAVLPNETLHSSISYATSADGVSWTKYDHNPVMDVSLNEWDSIGVETVSVIVDEAAPVNQRYKMWYAGQTFNAYRYEIGYAYSPDGIAWQKHGTAVISVGTENEWDNCFLEGPSVIKDGDTYKMWYAAYDCSINGQASDGKVNIGYATSTNGINWIKHPQNPVLMVTSGAWDAVYVQDPHVIKHQGTYHMWYGGADVGDNYFQQTGYAFSEDGIHWTKSARNPVLKRGKQSAWDANTASFPSVLIRDNQLHMWYTGKDVEPLPEFPTPYYWEIGYATKSLPETNSLD